MRVAFLTPEFVTEQTNEGGLASYLASMVNALATAGHCPEVVTLSGHRAGTVEFNDIPVHRVSRPAVTRASWRTAGRICRALGLPFELVDDIAGAALLARRLADLERISPYDVVQSVDFGFSGFFVRRRPWRTHILRCSWSAELYLQLDAQFRAAQVHAVGLIERRCIRQADRAYAPSRFIAEHYRQRHGLQLGVVRPPLKDTARQVAPDAALPEKFLLHFGQLRGRKGTDLVAAALPLVWAEVPEFRMVWAGIEDEAGIVARSRSLWGNDAVRVMYLGALERPQMMATLAKAVATVLPSRVDNLPNTVLESLSLNVPVIGSLGASIDELVEEGVNGYLVPIGDVEGLARAMIRVWRAGPGAFSMKHSETLEQMVPSMAVQRWVEFASGTSARAFGTPAPGHGLGR